MLSVTSLRRLCTGAALAAAAVAQAFGLTSPKEHFGFAIGDDYMLTTFTQTEAYFKKLAAESDRVQFVDIGPTEEGRRQPMLIVSSPQNLQQLDRYRAISEKLSRAEGLDDAQARALAAEGKAVVWIDGALTRPRSSARTSSSRPPGSSPAAPTPRRSASSTASSSCSSTPIPTATNSSATGICAAPTPRPACRTRSRACIRNTSATTITATS